MQQRVKLVDAARGALRALAPACDVTALGVLRALSVTGRSVPGDVAVVGFDCSVLAEAATLTSVHSPIEQEAQSAAAYLIDPSASLDDRLATRLVVRATS